MERKQLVHLTGFRAIAAYLVLVTHSADTSFTYNGASFAHVYVACLAYLGMSIFFVLSGFVITYTYYDRFMQRPWRQATRDFAAARFARLYPLYILFIFCDIHQWHILTRHGTFGELVSFFTLTQSWWNMQSLIFAPAWSISTECFFYLCFALWMLPGAGKCSAACVRRRSIVAIIGVLLVLAMAFAARTDITAFLSATVSRASNRAVWGWFQYISPYVRVGEFIAGVCAARMYMLTRYDEQSPAHQGRATLLCIGSIAIVVTFAIGNVVWFAPDGFLFFLSQNFGYAPFLAYIFYACSRYPNILTKWCSTRPMQIGGEISYSVYILQFWIYRHVLNAPVAEWPSSLAYGTSFLKVALYIILTTMIALCSYRIIEIPSRRFVRRLFGLVSGTGSAATRWLSH